MTNSERIDIAELRHSLEDALRRAEAGTDLVVTDRGRVVARIVGPESASDTPPVIAREERAAYAGEAGELDGAVTQLVSAGSTRRVLALFIREPAIELHQREIARRTRLGLRSAQLALKRLVSIGLLAERRDGNRLYFRAVRSDRFERIRELFSGEFGIAEVLARHLAVLETSVTWAFVFGSAARGEDRVDSDIDLLVVTESSDDDLVGPIADAQRELGREIDVVSYRPAEFNAKRAEGNHFLRSVLSQPRVDVIGGDGDA